MRRSKNLKALKRKASMLTLEDALNCIFWSSSVSKLGKIVVYLDMRSVIFE